MIDSWAQGSVPVVVRPQSSLAPSVSVISESVPGAFVVRLSWSVSFNILS